ncbi:SusD/RagB family nutrient-binding outer membrane lipoprotein [uncultured Fibrella sp.]|uniref:SusD/RagB family nutrient-binding outer membrane lipoprotein n=1 Tax=uncultured Fibrella sp. TaxID=1284596 RepID=UPI0035CC18EE
MLTKKLALGSLALLLMTASGCKDEFFDVNNNPNQVTAATPELVLPNALANTATYYQTSFTFLNLWMGYWNYSGNYSIATSDKNYQFTNTFNQGVWNNAYTNLKNYDYIEKQALAQNQPNAQAMAKIMKAFHYQILVDTYGNIPYTNALQGLTVAQPAYDTGVAVYEDLFKQIDAALALFASGQTRAAAGETITNPGVNDIMYQGDINKWRKFANTLKLRMILRQSERADRQAFIQSALAVLKASPYGFITTADQGATINPGYTNSTNQQNPLYATYGNGVNGQPVENNNIYRAGGYAVNFLVSTQDSRIFGLYNPVSGNAFGATFFGTISPLVNSQTSSIGPGVLQSPEQDAPILSAVESLFIQAEAVQRGYITGNAKTLYESAITQSYSDLGIFDDQGTAADYARQFLDSGNANVTWDVATNKLALILTQKWNSLNGTAPFESWSDFRRTGIPAVPISQDPSTSIKQIPARLLYPQTETQYNETAVKAQGTDSQFDKTKIFWIK